MLHHLPDSVAPGYNGPHQVIKEAYRILKDRGVLVVNTADPSQMEKAWLESYIIPAATERTIKR